MEERTLVASFHTMWDNFPLRARLIKKDRRVLAVNKAAQQEGLEVGVKCIDAPPKESHRGCKANLALKEKRGLYDFSANGDRVRYWVPVEGADDVYVHFSIPTSILEEASKV